MFPTLANSMANGDVLKTIQRLLETPNPPIPENVTAQLLLAGLLELSNRFEKTIPKLDAIEGRLDQMERSAQANAQLEAERDKGRVTIQGIFKELIQPVIVTLITAVVVGAIMAYILGGQ